MFNGSRSERPQSECLWQRSHFLSQSTMGEKNTVKGVIIDLDTFFVSVEQALNPKLKGEPVSRQSEFSGFFIAR